MSYLTGDGSDLFTHISMEKMYNKGSYEASDIYECFEIFKEKTNGVIYQHRKVLVAEYNLSTIKSHCKFFDFKIDYELRTMKNGKVKIVTKYSFTYLGKIYTSFKALNKVGVYVEREIHFDTILDLIPYLTYGVSMCACDKKSEHVVIGECSLIDKEEQEGYDVGYMVDRYYYRKNLSNFCLEVCTKYLCYKLEERTKVEVIPATLEKYDNLYYKMELDNKVDYNHKVDFVYKDDVAKPHWMSPKYVSDNIICISNQDVEGFLAEDIKKGEVSIKYVAYPQEGFPKYLK